MNSLQDLEDRRSALLERMRSIRSLGRGSITEQFFDRLRPGEKKATRQGPYYVFSRQEGGRTVSRRLTSASEIEQARRDVQAYKEFMGLCQEFVEVTEALGRLERKDSELEREKKRRRLPSNRTEK